MKYSSTLNLLRFRLATSISQIGIGGSQYLAIKRVQDISDRYNFQTHLCRIENPHISLDNLPNASMNPLDILEKFKILGWLN